MGVERIRQKIYCLVDDCECYVRLIAFPCFSLAGATAAAGGGARATVDAIDATAAYVRSGMLRVGGDRRVLTRKSQ
jgi:hypothetical protein